MKTFSGTIVDVVNNRIFQGQMTVEDGIISKIEETEVGEGSPYIVPGFVDAHIHIESSMLLPGEFARIAVQHGTIAAVCDAHEIANVLGVEGVRFMIENAALTPLRFFFSAPSCVPATNFESSGARIETEDIKNLFINYPQIKFLGEMMNFPGVISRQPEVMRKIEVALAYGKKIDGHAPGLMGDDLKAYAQAGISTDHECFSAQEALEKIHLGMKVLIREGSAVQNFDDLIGLTHEHYEYCAFCSDDKHPDELIKGHINDLVKRALNKGVDPLKVFRMASYNPVLHYGLEMGLLQPGDPADFVVVYNLDELKVQQTVINGQLAFDNGKLCFPRMQVQVANIFNAQPKHISDFAVAATKDDLPVIEVVDGQLITKRIMKRPLEANGFFISNPNDDVLKIAVVNRYENAPPAVGFVKNFGLKQGAIASSVAHDSHNIIAVGANDRDLCAAVNTVIAHKGGICAVSGEQQLLEVLPLPVAGLMSDLPFEEVAIRYEKLDALAKKFGSPLHAPFMTLSFMALLVIPELKISDKGLFDAVKFEFI